MNKSFLIIILLALFVVQVEAQESCTLHKHARNEIAISPGGVYTFSDKEWSFGAHAHYMRTLGSASPWALGGGLEVVTAHGGHYTVSVGAKYTFLHFLNFAVMPGVTFFKKDKHEHTANDSHHHHDSRARFSVHLEFSYDMIHTEHFHLGPAIDFSLCKNDNHFMIGLHCAYGF